MKRLLAILLLVPSLAYAQGIPLSALPSGAAISSTDLFYDVQTVGQGGVKVTATQLLTFVNANLTPAPPFTLALGTITANTNALNITGTWNNSGVTFDAPLFMNITNTASNSASLLADFQVGGVSVANFNTLGTLSLTNQSTGQNVAFFAGGASSSPSGIPGVVFKTSEGTVVSPTNISSGDGIGGIYAAPYVGGYQFNAALQFVQEASNKTAIILQTGSGGSRTEAFRVTGDGAIQFSNSGSFSANGSVATNLGSIGPTGSHTTVQTWLTFLDSGGTLRYVPAF